MTLNDLFDHSCNTFPNNPLIAEKHNSKYQFIGYQEAHDKVIDFALALLHEGFTLGEKGILLSEGRNYWLFAELAMLRIGMISVPVSIRIEENEDLIFRITHSESTLVIVSHRQINKIREIRNRIPRVRKIIILDLPFEAENITPEEGEILLSVLLNNAVINNELKNQLNVAEKSIGPSTPVNISYTSGTTSDPKGIVLTHENFITNVNQATAMVDVKENFTTLLLLPWDHSFAHTVGLYSLIKCGASMSSVETGNTPMETLRNIPKNLQEIKPVFLLSVPALAKNFKNNIENAILSKGKITRALFKVALKTSYFWQGNGFNRGRGFRAFSYILHKIFDAVLYRKIRSAFGGKLRFFIGGGALLDKEYQEFFHAIGIPMFQGYGLSEASPVISTNAHKAYKFGTSGKIVPELEVEIINHERQVLPTGQTGEIVAKGKNVMDSYWKNPKATSETLIDGKLFTGDMGYFDIDGFLVVTGRYKSLLISGDGEKYSPETIEETIISTSKWISQVMLYNHQNPYTIAFIYPNHTQLRKFNNCKTENISFAIIEEINKELGDILQQAAESKIIQTRWFPTCFGIMPEPFSEQNKMINSTMKIVRPRIIEQYKDLIKYLYTPEGKNPQNVYNNDTISKILLSL